MSFSRRHHYIPQFLIRNFTNDEGFLYVFNKKENRLNNKRQSPKSVFFEQDRNSVDFSGIEMDNLEKLYSELDTKLSIDLKNILSSKKIEPEELTSVVLLATLLKWRTPVSDTQFNILKEDTTIEDLSIKITVKGKDTEADKAAITHIENSEIFKETKRVLLSVLPLLNADKLLEINNNSFIYSNNHFPALIGDCPVIELNNTDFNKIENFIFPLSSVDTFIFKNGMKGNVRSPLFCLQRDLAIFHHSEKYVACKSKEHLKNIVEMYCKLKSENMTTLISKFVFEFIE